MMMRFGSLRSPSLMGSTSVVIFRFRCSDSSFIEALLSASILDSQYLRPRALPTTLGSISISTRYDGKPATDDQARDSNDTCNRRPGRLSESSIFALCRPAIAATSARPRPLPGVDRLLV